MKYLLFLGCWFVFAGHVSAATLSLSPTTVNLDTGKQTNLTLNLDPQGAQVIGTDIILTYNPQIIKVISVVNQQLFPGNPATIINNSLGNTKFSLIHNYGVYQTTPGNLATITIEGVSGGNSILALQMVPGDTRDTNVVAPGGLDVLTSVTNSQVNVSSPSSPQPTQTPTPTSTPTSNPSPTVHRPLSTVSPTTFPVPPGFLSPLPDAPTPTPKVIGKTLGLTNDLTATPAKARSLLLWLLPLILASIGLVFLISILRRPQKPTPSLTFYHP